MKKAERISRRADFQRLARYGRRIHRDHFVVLYSRNSLGNLRLGVTVNKKVGRAVIRNRIKRLVRERFRVSKAMFDGTYDINVVAKTGAAELSSQEITQTLEGIFNEISKDCKHEAIAADTY
ncbi:MAG: ribonuclease P protein component [Desulfobacterales bacterium]|nr:ribonuclease P protein component [Desulfobacterales bacterium]